MISQTGENKLSFESEDLVVDYITFNFDSFNESIKTDISNYFFELGFNSYTVDRKYRNPYDEVIKYDPRNTYNIKFVKNINAHWKGTLVSFPETSGAYFYHLAKNKQILWDLFELGILGRFDLNYLRPMEPDEIKSIPDFLRKSQETIRQKKINSKLEFNSGTEVLKIASRRSSRCGRIYTTNNSLKFEMEMRNNLIKNYNSLLVEDCFDELEGKLAEQYISYFGKLLPFQYCYTNWLSEKLRPLRYNKKIYGKPFIVNDYMESKTLLPSIDPKKFGMFLKFLKFTKNLDYEMEMFANTSYRRIVFRVKDFLKVCDSFYNSQNEYYKTEKTRQFLVELQQNLLITFFSDSYFKSLLSIPHVELYKCKQSKCWLAKIWLVEELFDYQYPFRLPDFFELSTQDTKMTKDQYLVRFEIIRVFSCKSVTKTFYIREFFNSHRVSNKRICEMKRIFIQLVQELNQFDLIESKVKLMLHGSDVEVQNLTTSNISEGFTIYEKIITK